MNCLQRVDSSNKAYLPPQAHCICGLRIALGIIAACGFSASIGALVSYLPPSVGYGGGSIAAVSVCVLALSYIKCAGETRQVREGLPLNSTTNSVEPIAILAGNDFQPLTIKSNNKKNLRKKIFPPTDSPGEKSSAGTVKEPIKRKKENHAVIRRITPEIDSLPQEVKLMILNYLKPRELANMSLANLPWREIACDNVLWARHCIDYLIPAPKNVEIIGTFAGQFAKIQKLTTAILSSEVHPKTIDFEKGVYAVLIDGDRVFLSFRDGIKMWDTKFSKRDQTLISGFSEYRIPDKLIKTGNILFCLHTPTANRNYDRRGILFAYDLARNEEVVEETPISLYEWEHGESKHRGGRLAFSENKAFCNYKNGDIRIWDFKKQYKEYTDDIEYDDYTGDEHDKDIQFLVKFQEELLRERQFLRGHTGQITHLSVSDNCLYSSSEDGAIKIWNIDTSQWIQTIVTDLSRNMYGSTVLGVDHFSVNGNYIFGYMYDSNENCTLCKLWNANTGLCLQTLELNMSMDSYCLHGNLLFFSLETTIHVYDLSTGQQIQTLNCDMPSDESYVKPKLAHLQFVDDKLICIGRKNGFEESGKQVFIFDFSSKL